MHITTYYIYDIAVNSREKLWSYLGESFIHDNVQFCTGVFSLKVPFLIPRSSVFFRIHILE